MLPSAYDVMTQGHFLSERVVQNGKRRKTWRYRYPKRHIMEAIYEYRGQPYTIRLQWSWWLLDDYVIGWERKPDEIIAVEERKSPSRRPNPVWWWGIALAA